MNYVHLLFRGPGEVPWFAPSLKKPLTLASLALFLGHDRDLGAGYRDALMRCAHLAIARAS